ncbi:putative DNA repair protein RadC homolog [Selenomonas ruminantium subsp. lactilytica TAM6421]|uniref:Putative DNA repair protein RadC homolog n=1 Tax=Selenomonas ruminantium subsp. lactilytica (strain NBRC 103574 / TAM6421) TaxID=927704 RepID=I0GQC4_SELRL|nr:DNA repair protein RadC [Selenomonas ruminantium]BAL82961.1 putative DNA repair protein RadC homolog [Selenomonas ruminantium subsp. lactilytica TAM6421]
MDKNLYFESNESLLASLLNVPAKNLACNNISDILTAPLSIKGIGMKKAAKIYALKEIVRRILNESPDEKPFIHTANDVANLFIPRLLHETKEHFMIALLNTHMQVLATPTISIGSLTSSIVHPREVFSETLKYPCASIVLVHNHPSGDPTPSGEDYSVTNQLVEAGKIMDIPVLDHVIIGRKRYYSMKERGIIS